MQAFRSLSFLKNGMTSRVGRTSINQFAQKSQIQKRVFSQAKQSTGIVGIPVEPRSREILTELYNQILRDVQILPDELQYRKLLESVTAYRLKVISENEDVRKIEDILQSAQVEELIIMAKDELQLIPKLAEWNLLEGQDEFSELPIIYEETKITHVGDPIKV